MTPSHSKVAAVMLMSLTLLAQLTTWVNGNPAATKQLERVIREAEDESKQLAKEINNWMNEQQFDEESHLRVRKSTEEENVEETRETRRQVKTFDGPSFTKIRKRRDALKEEVRRESSRNAGLVATKRSNPVLRAFDLMKLLISEREKSLKKSTVNKTGGKMKIGQKAKQGKAVKREKPPKQKKRGKYASRSATKSSKKVNVSRRTSLGKLASHNVKRKVKSGKRKATRTRNAVQILKAMPRKQLRKLLKEKGLGKFWNVVKVGPKKSVKRKFQAKKLKITTGKTIKRTHSAIKGRKDGKNKKSMATYWKKKTQIHKGKSKLAFRKAAPKPKKSKPTATDGNQSVSQNGRKRSNILRAPNKLHTFHAKKEDSKKRKKMQANHKFAALKDKIKQTNELKFKVAKALLAHCATENKLRNIFRDVNMSLKKAAVLVEIIGRKLGIEKGDVEKITQQHPEKAVQRFLSEVF